MKKVIIDFKPFAYQCYQTLIEDQRWSGLAKRYYDELFEFPPEKWGKMRREYGSNRFVSDNHTPFVIKVIVVDENPDRVWLYVTQFTLRVA